MTELEFIKEVLSLCCKYDTRGELHWYLGREGEIMFAANCSDTFAWGCADVEDITPENLALLKRSLEDTVNEKTGFSDWGMTLFACRARQARPMKKFLEILRDEKIVKLLEDCGPPVVDY